MESTYNGNLNSVGLSFAHMPLKKSLHTFCQYNLSWFRIISWYRYFDPILIVLMWSDITETIPDIQYIETSWLINDRYCSFWFQNFKLCNLSNILKHIGSWNHKWKDSREPSGDLFSIFAMLPL